jgi:hypothetical protein
MLKKTINEIYLNIKQNNIIILLFLFIITKNIWKALVILNMLLFIVSYIKILANMFIKKENLYHLNKNPINHTVFKIILQLFKISNSKNKLKAWIDVLVYITFSYLFLFIFSFSIKTIQFFLNFIKIAKIEIIKENTLHDIIKKFIEKEYYIDLEDNIELWIKGQKFIFIKNPG